MYSLLCSLTLCLLGNFACFLSSTDYFQNHLYRKILSGIPSECQADCILIRSDKISGLFWVQSACKGYQQRTLAGNVFKQEGSFYVKITNIGSQVVT